MHASCSICGDIFTGTDAEVLHSTPCGHIFHYLCLVEWLERSKTCPHCRAKVDEKKTVKLYFQLSNYPVKDSGTLENEVQSLKFQLSMKNMDLKKLTEEATEAKAVAKGLRSQLRKREEQIRSHETVVSALQDQIKILKIQMKSLTEAQMRADELQNKLEQYTRIEKILEGSTADAADALALMKDVSDPSILCSCISTLKKELYQYKEKARDLQNILKMKETKLASAVKKITELEEKKSILDRSLKKVQEDLTCTEKENENLKKTCKRLEEAIISPSGSESSSGNPRDKALRRFINEYPTPHLKISPTIELNVSTISNSTKNEESASPIMSQKEIKYKSLLTKRRLIPKISSDTDVQCFDGLGGHSKEITRTDRATLLNADRKSVV